MDEADKILIESLISMGLEITDRELSLENFSPDILINATGLCLEYIFESKSEPQSFPKSCPVNIGSRYKVGQTLSEAIKSLGYKDSVGYQAFLYPNIKDTRKIISFLIETLPKETGPSVIDRLNESNDITQIIKNTFSENWMSPWLPHYCRIQSVPFSQYSAKSLLIPFKSDRKPSLNDWFNSFPTIDKQVDRFDEFLFLAINYDLKTRICENINPDNLTKIIKEMNSTKSEQIINERLNQSKPEVRKRTKFIEKKSENVDDIEKTIEEAENEYEITEKRFDEIVTIYNTLLDKFDKLNEKFNKLSLSDKQLDVELESEKAKSITRRKIALILSNGEENLEKLELEIAKRRTQIGNIERQWQAHKSELTQEIQSISDQKCQKQTRTSDLEFQLADVKQQMESLEKNFREKTSEIKSLDEKVKQIIKANDQQNKHQNRNDFTKRILELTENKKKQKEEIKKILVSIFDLQKGINVLRGKLDRSFMEARDFMLDCSSKKDETAKRMHSALLGIHENCSELVSVIEEKGRLIREIREIDTNIENENKEDVEKNLEKITADYNEAKQNCESLKKLLKDYKRNQQAAQ